jgi:periplasmic mercuric ion binding protein
MKTLNSIAIVLIAAIIFSFTAMAEDQVKSDVLKLKTNVTNSESKMKIETIVSMLKGVEESELDLKDKVLTVKYEPSKINTDMIMLAIETIGYRTEVIPAEKDNKDRKDNKELGKKDNK